MAVDPSVEESRIEIQTCLTQIATLVQTDRFQSLLEEMRSTPKPLRHRFVRDVILSQAELTRRGINVPEGMTVQRSAFADGRPTLFCVTKYLKDGKRKVTITFDDDIEAL